jgi:hypothetical protein
MILILLAAICNAVMDVLSFHYHSSIFRYMNESFWNPEKSWVKKFIPFTKYRLDAWHVFKSLMICFLLLAAFGLTWKFFLAGAIWILTFNLFYNKVLR